MRGDVATSRKFEIFNPIAIFKYAGLLTFWYSLVVSVAPLCEKAFIDQK
tara:strand:- start:2427 stop:2573 length:147 start_codon:yes stop_codon:yes gene_type:complete